MRYEIDFYDNFEKCFLFWIQNFIRYKLTTLSNRQVTDKKRFQEILTALNKNINTINEIKDLAKEARQIGLIGINTYINPLEKLYSDFVLKDFDSMKEIDEEFIVDFLAVHTSSLSDATKKNYRMAIIGLFKYIDKQNQDKNGNSFVYNIELKHVSGLGGSKVNKLPTFMHDDEIKRFLESIETTEFKNYAQAKNRLLIKVILYTGMRVSEALSIRQKEMHLENGHYVFLITGKGNKQRIAMIKEHYIQKDLQEWQEFRPNTPLLFCSRTGKSLSQPYVSYIMDKILLNAGIRKEKNGAHMLRHTFATRLYQKNRDLILVQEALGHADLNTSRIYTHFDQQRLKAATSVMDDL